MDGKKARVNDHVMQGLPVNRLNISGDNVYFTFSAMSHLFTYGSLMFDQVWSLLINHDYQRSYGILNGFIRKAVINEHYPVVFRTSDTDRVEGLLYYNLRDADFRKLDAFEGEFYRRQQETIVLPQGLEIDAEVYVLKNSYLHIASEHAWDPDRFLQEGMRLFIDHYFGFNNR